MRSGRSAEVTWAELDACLSHTALRPEGSAGLFHAALSEKLTLSNGDDLRVGAPRIELSSTKSGSWTPVTRTVRTVLTTTAVDRFLFYTLISSSQSFGYDNRH